MLWQIYYLVEHYQKNAFQKWENYLLVVCLNDLSIKSLQESNLYVQHRKPWEKILRKNTINEEKKWCVFIT